MAVSQIVFFSQSLVLLNLSVPTTFGGKDIDRLGNYHKFLENPNL